MNDLEEIVDTLDAVIYADLFDCALDFEEVWRYGKRRVSREELRRRLSLPCVRKIVIERAGLFCLAGREALADFRPQRIRRAERIRRRTRFVASILRHAPFVRGILLTGSVAAENADEEADADLLIIVAEGRLALVFALLGPVSRLLARRLFCPNYYLSRAHLPMRRQSHYIARELFQAEPLAGEAADLLAANGWAGDHFPNAYGAPTESSPLRGGGAAQRLLELPFRGGLGNRLERAARRLARSRLAAHYRSSHDGPPAGVLDSLDREIELRFHAAPRLKDFGERYQARRAEIAEAIRRARPEALRA